MHEHFVPKYLLENIENNLKHKFIHKDLICFKIFVNFDNLSCFILLVQNVLIAPDQNESQWAKFPYTHNLYNTLKDLLEP